MKILVICQYYYPEPFRISDICEALAAKGHEVTVVTGVPNYPMGMIYDGYRHGAHRQETIHGVQVYRCFTIGRRSGALWRFLNYYSYAFSSTHRISQLGDGYDVVFVNQLSPVMMARAGAKYKKKYGKKLVLYCLDLWPESLAAGGIRKGSAIYRVFHHISEKLYRAADKILVTSEQFKDYFDKEFGIASDRLEYLPQYAEEMFSQVAECDGEAAEILKNSGIREPMKEKVHLVFAGNVGAAQRVDVIVRAAVAAEKQGQNSLLWHIVGDGSELERCKHLAEELGAGTVVFHGRQPVECMPAYYQMADAMLVTLSEDEAISYTLPGKVQSYMAAGKPIIASANGETPRVIERAVCGLAAPAENPQALVDVVNEFCRFSDEEKKRFGENGRTYYIKNFRKEIFIANLENILKEAGK